MDPKYIGVPNISFSLIDATDKRDVAFAKQRMQDGFDESELWSLNCTIARFILPRLRQFKEKSPACPGDMSPKVWNAKLSAMIKGFELSIKQVESTLDQHEVEKMDEGLELFFENFHHLWW